MVKEGQKKLRGKSRGKERGERGREVILAVGLFQAFVQSIYDFWQRPLCPVQLQAIMSSSQCSVCACFQNLCVSTACFLFYLSVDLATNYRLVNQIPIMLMARSYSAVQLACHCFWLLSFRQESVFHLLFIYTDSGETTSQ